MLKLSPILKRLGACHLAMTWLHRHKYKTFKEAWENVPSTESWHFWVIYELSRRKNGRTEERVLVEESDALYRGIRFSPNWRERMRTEFYLTPRVREAVERLLIEYGAKHQCLEECDEATIDANP